MVTVTMIKPIFYNIFRMKTAQKVGGVILDSFKILRLTAKTQQDNNIHMILITKEKVLKRWEVSFIDHKLTLKIINNCIRGSRC